MKKTLKTSLRYQVVSCLLIAGAVMALFPGFVHAEKNVLSILNWAGGYIDTDPSADPSLPIYERSPSLRDFMRQYNCGIRYEEYASEEDLMAKMFGTQKHYDVMIITSDVARKFGKTGHLVELTKQDVPNIKWIFPKYRKTAFDSPDRYLAPYLAGTTGIAYRHDMVGKEVNSWADYFFPPESLKGKLGALDSAYMICHALQYLEIDIHTRDEKQIKKAARLFWNLKKQGYLKIASGESSGIVKSMLAGQMGMAIFYSGPTMKMITQNPNIRYVVPKEGGEYYLDCMVLLKNADHPALGKAFINHILTPEVHANIAVSLNFLTPNKKSLEIIKKKFPAYGNQYNIFVSEHIELFDNIHLEALNRLWLKIKKTPKAAHNKK